ncbi:MAG: nucleoside hydrolase [Methylacidiphilales bacterium]|nr:nucleoside hydrolase [Candidatus Methylacidiphilales bacterium]
MNPPAVLHQTDLFRPHNDPDDHWDLACVYALAHLGRINLTGVLIDFPYEDPKCHRTPDILAVSQMNYLTGKAVPVMTGSSHTFTKNPDPAGLDICGAEFVLEQLRNAPNGLDIHIVGSCRDIAVALRKAPKLFGEKCRGIYLNAGMGARDSSLAEDREWNVGIDPHSYAAIFRAECPVYWMPCFEGSMKSGVSEPYRTREYATHYIIRQGDLFSSISPALRHYFLFMLSRSEECDWLGELLQDRHQDILQIESERFRNMWCTAGFLHSAGLGVSKKGAIKPYDALDNDAVFRFEPVQVTCNDQGDTKWQPDSKSTSRYLFRVLDLENYRTAMTEAMRSLLKVMP